MINPANQVPVQAQPAAATARDTILRARAVQLEAAFLSEMLGHAGMGAASSPFSGGTGEDQFASFLRAEQAKAIARKGGVGLAEHLFNALRGRADAAG
jgi:peptidoglycan hydrolase FlgJ